MIRRELEFLCFINDDTWNVKNGTSISVYERHIAEARWGLWYYDGEEETYKGSGECSDEA